jgi:antitoxin YokJ
LPVIEPGHLFPADLRQFYELCGGVDFFAGSDYPSQISPPGGLVLANSVIAGSRVPDDISDSWYIIARGDGSEFMTIDLHPDRTGICYDSFLEIHGAPGSEAIIATSFTDLLERILANQGRHWYWLEPDFVSLGDAYDIVR